MALTLPGMAAFLSACATLVLGVLGLLLALPIAAGRQTNSSMGFWRNYARLATAPLAFAVTGLLWAMYLNSGVSDGDRFTLWPPLTGALAGVCTYWFGRRA